MAKNRQVVREDVVRVSFEAPENPFQDIVDDLKDLKKATEKTVDGAEKELQDLGKAGKDASKGFSEITNESKKLSKMLNGIDKDISSFNNRISTAKKKFDSFKNSLKNIVTHPLKNTANTLRQIKDRLSEGQKGIKGFTTGLKNAGKVGFEKLVSGITKVKNGLSSVAKQGFTRLKSDLQAVANKLSDIAKKAGGACLTALKKVAGVSFKAMLAGLAGTATAVGAIVTKSVQSFADYEQLVGGVDTLFKDSSDIVQKNADRAFETAGLSANAYMETVTSFSASLLQSLGGDTKKAASVADKALVDMSDNANKMG